MSKSYNYFVSYEFRTKHNENGMGNCNVISENPISDIDDIRTIESCLKDVIKEKERLNMNNICIVNYQLLKEIENEDSKK